MNAERKPSDEFRVTLTVTNNNPDSIWNRLAERLGREPTHDEACAEVRRILATTTQS